VRAGRQSCCLTARGAPYISAISRWVTLLAMSGDNAGIYFFGPPPSFKQFAAMAAEASVTEATDGEKSRVSIAWSDVTIVVTIDPRWNRTTQLRGIRTWLLHFPESERQSLAVQQFLADLDRTTTCYGCVISPSYDGDGKVVRLLIAMLEPTGGFFFTHQSFYGSSGERIAGIDGDPGKLGGAR
jgi:hypothetical protein